ncbi:MAG: Lrp/AsnC family transcriptional regulator [Hadesarchaea archaeon]|nr:Lrp/AsnC family transcriptional regulator [Hadesarchaea archaeon]
MDNVDMELLKMLVRNARISLRELGLRVGLSTSGVRRRIKQMEKAGVIKGYAAVVDPKKSGKKITAFLRVKVNSHDIRKVGRSLARYAEVCEVHRITGDHSLIAKVRTQDLDSLNKFIEDKLNSHDGVVSVSTAVAMETFRENGLGF